MAAGRLDAILQRALAIIDDPVGHLFQRAHDPPSSRCLGLVVSLIEVLHAPLILQLLDVDEVFVEVGVVDAEGATTVTDS